MNQYNGWRKPPKNNAARVMAGTLLAVLLLMMGSCFLALKDAKAEVTQPRLTNSLGVVAYTANPYIYNVGAVTGARIVDGENLQVDFNPMGTFQIYRETVQFCGDPRELFEGKANPVVLTYTRSSPRMVEGRGCHQLIRVDKLQEER